MRENAEEAKCAFLFMQRGWQGIQWSARRRIYLNLPSLSLLFLELFHQTLPSLLLLLRLLFFAFSFFVGWLSALSSHILMGIFPITFFFYCRKCQRTTLREPKECSILSSAQPSQSVSSLPVCVRGVRRGGGGKLEGCSVSV